MDKLTNQSNPTGDQGRMIDFVPKKSNNEATADSSKAPRPVTSAKDAINALYADRAKGSTTKMIPSAREAVNAAASKTVAEHQKSAATLHHGSIQKKMESTRTSASAMLKVAKSEKPSPTSAQPLNSFDPLAKPKPVAKPKRPRQVAYGSVPVVRTSLKLGASARPKPTPVVLPPHARMAEGARPVNSRPKKLSNLLNHRLVNGEIVPRANTLNAAPKRQLVEDVDAIAVAITEPAKPAPAHRPSGPIRDPQMVRAPRRTTNLAEKNARRAMQTARVADIVSEQMGQPSRFATAPKGYVAKQPEAMPADSAYIMSEPPKLTKKHPTPPAKKPEDKLGVIENYHQSREPQPLGDKAPIGRVTEQKIASGHGGAAKPTEKVKADNTSNYSFSRQLEPDANRYALGGQSPFLKSVNVEKRPLSGSAPRMKSEPKVSGAVEAESKPRSKKNIYPKKEVTKTPTKQDLPSRPTVIVPSSHRSKAPLFFLVLLTVILGAAVGAAAYLCFFQ